MSNKKTNLEAIELLKQGKKLRYYYMSGCAVFIIAEKLVYVEIAGFLSLRADGIIDCESGVDKRDCTYLHGKYQEYFFVEK